MVKESLRPQQQDRGEVSQLVVQQCDLCFQGSQLLVQVGF
jgi:hypothetical protein